MTSYHRFNAIVAGIFLVLGSVYAFGTPIESERSQQERPAPAPNGDLRPAAAGDLDPSFNTGIGVTLGGGVQASALQSDGKILLGGTFSSYNGTSCNGLVRVNTDGSIDTSFHSGAATQTAIYSIVIQNDGKILIGGGLSSYNGSSRNGVARLNVDGTLDTTFNPGTGTGIQRVYSIAVQADQKILLGGNFTSFNGTVRVRIARLNSDGSLDTSFDPGSGTAPRILAIAVQSDGKILAAGPFINFNGVARPYLVRLNTNGSVDTSFLTGIQTVSNGSINALAIQPDGKIVVGGSFNINFSSSMLIRLNADGTSDGSFTAATGGSVQALALQTDGKIVVAGNFITYNGTARSGIARANSNGSLDASFTPGTGATGGQSDPSLIRNYSLALQADGRILFGGFFAGYASVIHPGIVRVNTDGSADAAFDTGNGVGSVGLVNCVRVQADGKILIAGRFIGYDNVRRFGIARLNSNGTLDSSFDTGTGMAKTGSSLPWPFKPQRFGP